MSYVLLKLRRLTLIKLKSLLLLFTLFGHAALELELTQGIEGALPIGIVPIVGEEKLDESITSVIVNDLNHSGRFHVRYKEYPLTKWRDLGVGVACLGRIDKAFFGGTQIHFELYDTVKNIRIFTQTFNLKKGYERQLAHHIADLFYQRLTDERGIFSTKLAYILTQREASGQVIHHLQIADFDGKRAKSVVRSNQPLMSPSWSSDGRSLAFVSFENRRAAIYRLDVQTGKRELITHFPGINGAPAWSPDGQVLALVLSKSGYPKIYTIHLKTKKLTQLTDGISIDTEPDWAPDGRSLVFTSDRGGRPQIYRYDFDSKKVKRVTFVGDYNARARFSSDGRALIMLHRQDGLFNIALLNFESNEMTLLSHTGRSESPTFSPNGKMVLYASTIGQKGILNLVSTDGKVKVRLPSENGDVQEPAWSPYLS